MKFYTWCNDKNSEELQRLLLSAKMNGIDVEPIGEGRDIHEGEYEFHFKNLWLYEKVCELSDDEIVMCTDAFDVIYFAGETEIQEKFLSIKSPIVYSAERYFGHNFKRNRVRFNERSKNNPFKYLNAGVMMGYVWAIKSMLDDITKYSCKARRREIKGRMMDQTLSGIYLLENPKMATLDYKCDIFWTTVGFEYPRRSPNSHEHPLLETKCLNDELDKIYDDRIFNKFTNSHPCILHGPWIGKKMIEVVWNRIQNEKNMHIK